MSKLSTVPVLIFAALLLLTGSTSQAESADQLLVPTPVVRAKAAEPISTAARTFLEQRDGDIVKVWVFFTDKGLSGKDAITRTASAVGISDKVMKRRAKVDRDRVLFVDLPVPTDYVDALSAAGATVRRVSRWLNAASVAVSADKLDTLGDLPFVASMRPVAGFKRPGVEATELRREDIQTQSLAADVLNYGISASQLAQISVPEAHDRGLDGSGVTLAILDTGYRKSHEAFANHYADGRVLAEYDFIFNDGETANEAEDWSSQWNHGTYIWSTSAGYLDGQVYGPAYKANFLLAKTEDVRSETSVEEDNWVAALEWADSLGADVLTSSLGYSNWYTYEDFDGETAITTVAANTAAGLGIVVCNSMGNGGPGSGTLTAPADAHDILACGAVDGGGNIAGFSSRGPTYDGRTKPEVCAQGVSTACASASSNTSYSYVNGTSLSTPLVAGAACLLVQARPDFPPQLIRQALMETADNAGSPDNTYGSGIINANDAVDWGADFLSDVTIGNAPMTVQFYEDADLSSISFTWDFGDGEGSTDPNPSHVYDEPGLYDVSLTIETLYGNITSTKPGYIFAAADTLEFHGDSAYAGENVIVSVHLTNSQPVNNITVPFSFQNDPALTFVTAELGSRASYFEDMDFKAWDPANNSYTIELIADDGGGAPLLPPGSGEVLRLTFTIDPLALGGFVNPIDTGSSTHSVELVAESIIYPPAVLGGAIGTRYILRGDMDNSLTVNIVDLTRLVSYLFASGDAPLTTQSGDVNGDFDINIEDVTHLVAYLFTDGPAPPTP